MTNTETLLNGHSPHGHHHSANGDGAGTSGDAGVAQRLDKQRLKTLRVTGEAMRSDVERQRFGRVRSREAAAGATDYDRGALEAELALLREETAWLRADRCRLPDAATVTEWMRRIAAGPAHQDLGDEALQSLAEAFVMREVLLGACDEIAAAMGELKRRLTSIEPHSGLLSSDSLVVLDKIQQLTNSDASAESRETR